MWVYGTQSIESSSNAVISIISATCTSGYFSDQMTTSNLSDINSPESSQIVEGERYNLGLINITF